MGGSLNSLTLPYQTYQDVPKLSRVLAVINETLRLFSPVSLVLVALSGYRDKHNYR